MFITPSFKKSLIVEQFQGNYLKVWSEDKLNKKFVVAENVTKLVSKSKRFCLYSFIS